MINVVIDKDFLSQRSEEVDIKEERDLLNKIILDLKTTIRDSEGKIKALSAIQIGIPKRVFVIHFNDKLQTFINPLINKANEGTLTEETCISLPDKRYWIANRANVIEFFYQTPLNKEEGGRLKGASAHLFQQMVDLLDGVMIDDYGIEITEELEKLSAEEKEELFTAYSLFTGQKSKELRDQMKEEIDKAIKDENNEQGNS